MVRVTAPLRSAVGRSRSDPAGADGEVPALTRDGLQNLLGAGFYGVMQLLTIAVIARGLGTATRAGALLEAIALFTIAARSAELGAGIGLNRTIPRASALGRLADIRRTVRVAVAPPVVAASLLAAALVVWREPVARVMTGSAVTALPQYLGAMAPFLPLATASAVMVAGTRALGTMRPAVLIDQVARAALHPAAVAAALLAGASAIGVASAWAAPFAVSTVAIAFCLWRLSPRHDPSRTQDRPWPLSRVVADFWRFATPQGVATAFQVTLLWVDVLLLGALASPREAGIYAAATRFLLVGAFIQNAARLAVQPRFSAYLTLADAAAARRLFQITNALVVALSWPFFLAIALFAPLLLRALGPEYVEGAPVLIVLSLAWMAATGAGLVDAALVMGGRSGLSLLNTGAALIVNVVLNVVLIPRHGMIGAAVAWAVALLVHNGLPMVQVARLFAIRPLGGLVRTTAPLTLLCYGVVGLAVRLAFDATFPALVAYVVVGTGLYAVAIARSPVMAPFAQAMRRSAPNAGQVGA